MNSRKI